LHSRRARPGMAALGKGLDRGSSSMHVVAATDLRLDVSVADYAILAVYFIVVLGIGFAARRSVSSSLDFFRSGRSLPAWVTGLAFISANLGAIELLGMAANGAQIRPADAALGMLALGLAFLAWALLRPLTLETIHEGQAESADTDAEHEELIGSGAPVHRRTESRALRLRSRACPRSRRSPAPCRTRACSSTSTGCWRPTTTSARIPPSRRSASRSARRATAARR
jgi:hypothetical protein